MTVLALIASVILGLTFLAAGVSKLVDRRRWEKQAGDLGIPALVATLVPWVELILGASLVAQFARPWSALAAIALLAAFTTVVIVRLLDGSRPPCACFGVASSRPLSGRHVVRNVVMVGLAIIAAVAAA